MCSSVRPSRSTCLRPAAISRSMSAALDHPSLDIRVGREGARLQPAARHRQQHALPPPCTPLARLAPRLRAPPAPPRAARRPCRSSPRARRTPRYPTRGPPPACRLARGPRLRHRHDDADGLAGADVQQPDDVIGTPARSQIRTHATHSNACATPCLDAAGHPPRFRPRRSPCGLRLRAPACAPGP